jgi:6-pyruvoyltetrahydropterin/6-carboxytetrahydropterin synthase
VFLYAKAEEEQIFDSELEEEIQAEMHKDDDNEDETIYRIYRYKFYLDASHQVKIDGNIGEVHPHTWEFAVELKGMKHIIVPFNEIEATVNKVLDKYQEKCLNEMSPFDKLNPTSENIAGYFFSLIQYQMELNSWELLSLELSESPNRTIVITKD